MGCDRDNLRGHVHGWTMSFTEFSPPEGEWHRTIFVGGTLFGHNGDPGDISLKLDGCFFQLVLARGRCKVTIPLLLSEK